eukprot:scaffold9348_cov74-Phaeocystis_antarctica.AAC.5
MLKPLNMIIKTSRGGNIASAASVDGATAPKKRPRPPEAKPSSTSVSRKAKNLSGLRLPPWEGQREASIEVGTHDPRACSALQCPALSCSVLQCPAVSCASGCVRSLQFEPRQPTAGRRAGRGGRRPSPREAPRAAPPPRPCSGSRGRRRIAAWRGRPAQWSSPSGRCGWLRRWRGCPRR